MDANQNFEFSTTLDEQMRVYYALRKWPKYFIKTWQIVYSIFVIASLGILWFFTLLRTEYSPIPPELRFLVFIVFTVFAVAALIFIMRAKQIMSKIFFKSWYQKFQFTSEGIRVEQSIKGIIGIYYNIIFFIIPPMRKLKDFTIPWQNIKKYIPHRDLYAIEVVFDSKFPPLIKKIPIIYIGEDLFDEAITFFSKYVSSN